MNQNYRIPAIPTFFNKGKFPKIFICGWHAPSRDDASTRYNPWNDPVSFLKDNRKVLEIYFQNYLVILETYLRLIYRTRNGCHRFYFYFFFFCMHFIFAWWLAKKIVFLDQVKCLVKMFGVFLQKIIRVNPFTTEADII